MMDKTITGNVDFRLIIKSNIRNMFSFALEGLSKKINSINVDMNSVMSILFNYDKINDKDLMNDITDIFEEFIDVVLSSGVKIKFIYSGTPSLVHTTVYPGWCKKRYERVNIKNSDFILNFLNAMRIYSKSNKLVEIVNIGDKHIAHYIFENSTYASGDIYIVSKDYAVQSLISVSNAVIFTGVCCVDYRDTSPSMYGGVNPRDILPKGSEWIIPTIMGDVRNEYKGEQGYGQKNTIKYLNKNRIKVISEREHQLSDFINTHRSLYDVVFMSMKYNELVASK